MLQAPIEKYPCINKEKINICRRLTVKRDLMLTWAFIYKSVHVKYNPMYVLIIILCTDINAIAVAEISQEEV